MASEAQELRYFVRRADVSEMGYGGWWVQDRERPRYLGMAFCADEVYVDAQADAQLIALALNQHASEEEQHGE